MEEEIELEREPSEKQQKEWMLIMGVCVSVIAAWATLGMRIAIFWGTLCVLLVFLYEKIPKKK
jgi:membrane protein insertase Oxa1/YidC/SpoIIIJ|tara:strand:+ start:11941 stop:12129 length:189 start_codon:yes stop_codon:yes gene_type:complete